MKIWRIVVPTFALGIVLCSSSQASYQERIDGMRKAYEKNSQIVADKLVPFFNTTRPKGVNYKVLYLDPLFELAQSTSDNILNANDACTKNDKSCDAKLTLAEDKSTEFKTLVRQYRIMYLEDVFLEQKRILDGELVNLPSDKKEKAQKDAAAFQKSTEEAAAECKDTGAKNDNNCDLHIISAETGATNLTKLLEDLKVENTAQTRPRSDAKPPKPNPSLMEESPPSGPPAITVTPEQQGPQ